MLLEKTLFPELFGFVIFDISNLSSFKRNNGIGSNILECLTSTDFGDKACCDGIAIPMMGIEEEYYYFCISKIKNQYLTDSQIQCKSPGWILNISSEVCTICGIGYLTKFNEQDFSSNPALNFSIINGWYTIDIYGGFDSENRPVYELVYTPQKEKPVFSGSFENPLTLNF
jgi:hypothetical protein